MKVKLETERLLIRQFRTDDWRGLKDYIHTPQVSRYEPGYPSGDKGARQMAEYFASRDDFWAVCLRESGQLIGHVHFGMKEPTESLTWNLGFVFNPKFSCQGYATEASRRVLQYGFEVLKVRRVEAGCNPENIASWRVLEKLGMRREAHHLKNAVIMHTEDGQPIFWDSYIYAMLREEFVS